jgi:hypothetical protein
MKYKYIMGMCISSIKMWKEYALLIQWVFFCLYMLKKKIPKSGEFLFHLYNTC